jgi:hypothetical protein
VCVCVCVCVVDICVPSNICTVITNADSAQVRVAFIGGMLPPHCYKDGVERELLLAHLTPADPRRALPTYGNCVSRSVSYLHLDDIMRGLTADFVVNATRAHLVKFRDDDDDVSARKLFGALLHPRINRSW